MRNVCYTANFGNYDKVREPIVAGGWDYVLFTDNKDLKSDVYDVRYVKPIFNSVRMARYIKIMYFEFLSGYDNYFWHDSSIQVNTDLNDFFRDYEEADITLFEHPARNCIYKEAETVMRKNIDKPFKILPQLEYYKNMNFPKEFGLHSTIIMLRKDSEKLRSFMRSWWGEITKFSHRDQLSFDFVRFLYKDIDINDMDNYWELLERGEGKFRFKPHLL